ncbi:MAG: hypothetical protein V4576_04130 [Patescibacteria group bacterium]
MKEQTPTIIILIGITGDLSKRKLLPAITNLESKGQLPELFKLIGITRREEQGLFKMDLTNPGDYQKLKEHIEGVEKEWGITAQKIFYLSVAPKVSLPIIKLLGESGIAELKHTKIMLEKPFGLDLENAKEFVNTMHAYFSEDQIYRVDHYLAKDSVQALRAHEFDFTTINQIEISASETIGVDGREMFYEQTGALRDFIQSHLLEVAATCITPNNRLLALKQLYVPTELPIVEYVKRGQYKGYKELVQNPDSNVETKVAVTLQSHDARLKDIFFTLKTGKALDRKSTDITVYNADGTRTVISLNDTENAYERVFIDAIEGNKDIFVGTEEMLETWRILNPIQTAWAESTDDLLLYEVGSEI